MLLELLTPIVLATAPQTSEGLASTYNHNTQNIDGWISTKEVISAQSTRTFDFQGRPNDSDWD